MENKPATENLWRVWVDTHRRIVSFHEEEGCQLLEFRTREMFLRCQMTELSMDRNRIFRVYQRINQLDFFLAGMSGYVRVLENNFRAFSGKVVDDT